MGLVINQRGDDANQFSRPRAAALPLASLHILFTALG